MPTFKKLLALTATCTLLGGIYGCSSDNGDEEFNLSGTMTTNTSPTPKVTGATTGINYVYAVRTSRLGPNPPWRSKAAINADGSFSINLEKGYNWALAFVDSSKTGQDMIQAIFKASALDSVSPLKSSARSGTEVGTLSADTAGVAELDPAKYTTYVGDLGMTLAEAAQYGALDDLSLRYINPDIDGNGIMDMDDANMPAFKLELSQSYRFGTTSYMDNVRSGQPLPANTDIFTENYSGSGPNGLMLSIVKPATGFFSSQPGKFSLEWSNSGNYTGTNPAVWDGSTPSILWYHLWDTPTEGLQEHAFAAGFDETVTDLPDGTYTFRFYANATDTAPSETWTFPYVKTSDDTTNTESFVFPFPVLHVDANDTITSVSYQWMKKEGNGFVAASSKDVELLVGTDFANIGWGTAGCGDYTCANKVEWRPYDTGYATTGSFNASDFRPGANAPTKRNDVYSLGMTVTTKLGTFITLHVY